MLQLLEVEKRIVWYCKTNIYMYSYFKAVNVYTNSYQIFNIALEQKYLIFEILWYHCFLPFTYLNTWSLHIGWYKYWSDNSAKKELYSLAQEKQKKTWDDAGKQQGLINHVVAISDPAF